MAMRVGHLDRALPPAVWERGEALREAWICTGTICILGLSREMLIRVRSWLPSGGAHGPGQA